MTLNFSRLASQRLSDVALSSVLTVLAMVLSWTRGQDANWDLLNYHLYNAWALFGHVPYHFTTSIQGYFYPYLDVPYYMLATGLLAQHPQLLQALVGIPYGTLLCEIVLLAHPLVAEIELDHAWQRSLLIVLMVALAGSGASVWVQVGTTTNEITIAVVVMAGVLLLAQGAGRRAQGCRRHVCECCCELHGWAWR